MDNESRWVKVDEFAAAMDKPQSGSNFTEPMMGRTASGQEVGFVTARSDATGVTWSEDVSEVLVEPRNRARGWLSRPLW